LKPGIGTKSATVPKKRARVSLEQRREEIMVISPLMLILIVVILVLLLGGSGYGYYNGGGFANPLALLGGLLIVGLVV